jgi:hypothetical protein
MRQLSVLVAFYVEIDSFREELRKKCSHSYLFKYEFNAEIQEFQKERAISLFSFYYHF